jgi:prepilin-type N-terminal cleavage/methylation domain-containing protein
VKKRWCALVQRARDRRRCDERGYTLVEVVATITILGLSGVAVLTAMTASVTASSRSKAIAKADTVAASATDRLNSSLYVTAPGPGTVPTAYVNTLQGATSTVGWPATTVTVVGFQCWNGSLEGLVSPGAGGWTSDCTGTVPQRLSVRITSPDGRVSHTFDLVKSYDA